MLDKAVHFGFYAVLGVLARRVVARRPDAAGAAEGRSLKAGAGWLLVPALAIFAGLDELHQAWIPGRDPSLSDWAADVAGIAVGIGVGSRRTAKRGRPERGTPDRRSRDGA
ncbi:MAG: VanZ family protein [Gemmatimonadota bacterium]